MRFWPTIPKSITWHADAELNSWNVFWFKLPPIIISNHLLRTPALGALGLQGHSFNKLSSGCREIVSMEEHAVGSGFFWLRSLVHFPAGTSQVLHEHRSLFADIAVWSLEGQATTLISIARNLRATSCGWWVEGCKQVVLACDLQLDRLNSAWKWQKLSGSEQAALYLQRVDEHEHRSSVALLQSRGCGDAENDWAKETCFKHLGEAHAFKVFLDSLFWSQISI